MSLKISTPLKNLIFLSLSLSTKQNLFVMASDRDRNEPDYVPPGPKESLHPIDVTPEVISIAQKMKKDAEKKLKIKPGYTTFTPLSYIKEGETDYCIRVKVDNDQLIDVFGKYVAGSVMRVKAKTVTEDNKMTFDF
ncbi:PREDICTED: uncharacterized protein LOC109583050 [Amphimedon queenslandica]|uniref:Uncharacterized protein n=1 Tax=Amphimedon queenslandica TaxID=400682 RepID=A0AAN0JAL9_AMPQE|nr:PREDICTED: uncharacterized protein LOC109583050 [Amphimedon queenslandica]|eukprot:XP_019853781.1 PREDICTED: uncharacterized protein LOC109583050 [Amphimedon queenslandica]